MVQIFISWSGHKSRHIAKALHGWLPDVFQQVEVWMSEHDIDAGSRWSRELTSRLESSQFGIICLTPENQDSPWLLFEAGSLSKTAEIARVVPYLFGISPTDVRFPLAQFQGVEATKIGTFKLLKSINESANLRIADERLDKFFAKWWPDLESQIKQLSNLSDPKESKRTERELLEEILSLVRDTSRQPLASTPHSKRSILGREYIEITLEKFFSTHHQTLVIEYHPFQSVSSFLDFLYFFLNEYGEVPPYTYGTVWLLKDEESGNIFNDIGIEYCQTKGDIPDLRTVMEVGIKPGIRLAVIRVGLGED